MPDSEVRIKEGASHGGAEAQRARGIEEESLAKGAKGAKNGER
jgi:hypothetical protein